MRKANSNMKGLLLGSAMSLVTGVALGQDEESGRTGGFEEIIVTAQKRAENVQTVPIAVSVISSAEIEEQNLRDVMDLTAQVPGLYIATPYADAVPMFSLRGVSVVDFSQNQSSPIALYVDEAYKGLPVFTSLQLFDLDRVEVLRGPQGTLFGRNATGGAVNAYTKKPEVDEGFGGYFSAGYGRFNRWEADGGANIPIVPGKAAGRAAFTFTEVDGYSENLFPGQPDGGGIDDWAVRGSLALHPADTLDIQLAYGVSRSSPPTYTYHIYDIGAAGPGGAGFGTGYTRAGLDFYQVESDRTGNVRIENQNARMQINWDVSSGIALTSVTSFEDGDWFTAEDADGSPFNLLHTEYASNGARSYAQDLRLASMDGGPFQWLVGGYYYRDKINTDVSFQYYYEFAGDNDGSGVLDCFEDFITGCRYSNELTQRRESFAFYTQNSYDLQNGLTLTAGLRYTEDDNRLDSYESFFHYLDPATGEEVTNAAQLIAGPPVDTLKSNNISFKAGLSYEFEQGTFAYFHASRGYRGGSFNGQAFFDPTEVNTAPPETLLAYEAGLKTTLMDNRLRVNSAIFHYDYKNQQFIDVTPELLQVLVSADKSRLWGVDVEGGWQLTPNLAVRFGASYLNAEFKEATLQGVDVSGNRILLAPEWTATGGIDWRIYEGDIGTFSLRTDHRYTSRVYFNAFEDENLSEPGYAIHDARLTYQPTDALSISAWVKNASAQEYAAYRFNILELYNFNIANRGRPREYGMQATVRF